MGEPHPWELIYRREGRVFSEPYPRFHELIEKFRAHRCRTVLDLGCGNGRHVVALARLGFVTVGLDISLTGLRLTRDWLGEEHLPAALVVGDTHQGLPFQAASFDGVLSTQVIHHACLAEVRRAVAEIWRVLREGGIAFVTVSGGKHAEVAYEEIEPGTYRPLSGTEKGLPHHFFDEDALRFEFRAFDFVEVSRRAEGKVLAVWAEKSGVTFKGRRE